MNVFAAGLWGGLAALSLLLGAVLAMRFTLSNRVIGAVMGFGSGALISSIGYELVPESLVKGTGRSMALTFALGTLTFFVADWAIDARGGEKQGFDHRVSVFQVVWHSRPPWHEWASARDARAWSRSWQRSPSRPRTDPAHGRAQPAAQSLDRPFDCSPMRRVPRSS